jgi:Effector-associated domain 1
MSRLTESEVQALALAFHSAASARQLLEAAGLSRRQHPGREGLSSEEFWREVNALVIAGVMPAGRERILAAAQRSCPANSVFGSANSRGSRHPDSRVRPRQIIAISSFLVAVVVGVMIMITLRGDGPKTPRSLIEDTAIQSPKASPARAAINPVDPFSSFGPTIECSGNPTGTPFGRLDPVEVKANGSVEVVGWAFDVDDLGKAVHIHIYIDGRAGSGARHVDAGLASVLRPDVAAAHPNIAPGDRHGFRFRINNLASGPHPHTFWVYAINVSGPGDNCFIGADDA